MKSPEFVVHGTSSESDAKKIEDEGFKFEEGRATVSADLIYAFEWATEQERRRGSQSLSEVGGDESGRVVIMGLPEGMRASHATHTGVEFDDERKEVSGYTYKYVGGRKQLGIFGGKNAERKKQQIEKAKSQVAAIRQEIADLFDLVGLDGKSVHSKDDLIKAISQRDPKDQIVILSRAEELEKKLAEKRHEAEIPKQISKEQVLLSIVPTPEIGQKLGSIRQDIYDLKKIDLDKCGAEIRDMVMRDEKNTISSGANVEKIINDLLRTTLETEVINMIRSLSLGVRKAKGYKVSNRSQDELGNNQVDRERIKGKLEYIRAVIESDGFSIGLDHLDRYIRMNVKKLSEELG